MSELAKALAKAQAAFPSIPKTRTAKVRGQKKDGGSYEYSYDYADLSDVLEAVKPILSENGLALLQPMRYEDGQTLLVTQLLHTSGESVESVCPLFAYERPQEMGSGITYLRRYSLCAILGIATEEDDDAQAGNQPKKPKSEGVQSTSKESAPSPSAPSGDRGKKLGHLSQLCQSRDLKITDELGGPASGASDEAIEEAIRRVQQIPEAEKAS